MKAAELLRRAGVLDDASYAKVATSVRSSGDRSEDVLVTSNLMTEAKLLQTLSGLYKAHFVSTEKLAKAEIPRSTLLTVPRKIAEKFNIFPVTFDAANGVLGVVTPDPEQDQVLTEVRLVAGAKQIKPFVARPAAVRAAIAKHYGNDLLAFQRMGQASGDFVLDYGRQLHADGSITEERTSGPPVAMPAGQQPQVPTIPKAPEIASARARKIAARPVLEAPVASKPPSALLELEAPPTPATAPAAVPPPVPGKGPVALLVPSVEALVDLVDAARPDLAGHSRDVGRLLARLAKKLGLSDAETEAVVFAGLIHDLGKTDGHFTALNVARSESHRGRAAELFDRPLTLLESARLNTEVRQIVAGMYERVDGAGLPRRLAGDAIPRGARMLALVDTYVDLTQNPKNPYRRALSASEALSALDKYAGTLFDEKMLEDLKALVAGQKTGGPALGKILVLDRDPVALEQRLREEGFDVKSARSLASAREVITSQTFDMIVSDAALPDGDTLMFLALARGEPWGEGQTWVFYTDKQSVAQRAFDLGAADFIVKPASVDLVATKIRARLESAPRGAKGVSGSLREMSLPDIVQMLINGGKTGKLVIRSGARGGEVHFEKGAIVHALQGEDAGPDAFYALAALTDGDFALDPSFTPGERTIRESGEALLLEAMRRLDEAM